MKVATTLIAEEPVAKIRVLNNNYLVEEGVFVRERNAIIWSDGRETKLNGFSVLIFPITTPKIPTSLIEIIEQNSWLGLGTKFGDLILFPPLKGALNAVVDGLNLETGEILENFEAAKKIYEMATPYKIERVEGYLVKLPKLNFPIFLFKDFLREFYIENRPREEFEEVLFELKPITIRELWEFLIGTSSPDPLLSPSDDVLSISRVVAYMATNFISLDADGNIKDIMLILNKNGEELSFWKSFARFITNFSTTGEVSATKYFNNGELYYTDNEIEVELFDYEVEERLFFTTLIKGYVKEDGWSIVENELLKNPIIRSFNIKERNLNGYVATIKQTLLGFGSSVISAVASIAASNFGVDYSGLLALEVAAERSLGKLPMIEQYARPEMLIIDIFKALTLSSVEDLMVGNIGIDTFLTELYDSLLLTADTAGSALIYYGTSWQTASFIGNNLQNNIDTLFLITAPVFLSLKYSITYFSHDKTQGVNTNVRVINWKKIGYSNGVIGNIGESTPSKYVFYYRNVPLTVSGSGVRIAKADIKNSWLSRNLLTNPIFEKYPFLSIGNYEEFCRFVREQLMDWVASLTNANASILPYSSVELPQPIEEYISEQCSVINLLKTARFSKVWLQELYDEETFTLSEDILEWMPIILSFLNRKADTLLLELVISVIVARLQSTYIFWWVMNNIGSKYGNELVDFLTYSVFINSKTQVPPPQILYRVLEEIPSLYSYNRGLQSYYLENKVVVVG